MIDPDSRIQWGKFKMPGTIILYVLTIGVTFFAVNELHWLALLLTIPLGLYISSWTDKEYTRMQKAKVNQK